MAKIFIQLLILLHVLDVLFIQLNDLTAGQYGTRFYINNIVIRALATGK